MGAIPFRDLRVLFISERYPPDEGGLAVSAQRTCSLLSERIGCVDVLTTSHRIAPGRLEAIEDGKAILHIMGRMAAKDLTNQMLGNYIGHLQMKRHYHIFHGFYAVWAGYLASIWGSLYGVKSAMSIRGNDVDRSMFTYQDAPFLFQALKIADGIACVSRELVHKCRVLSGRDDIAYIPNSVAADLFTAGLPDAELKRKCSGDTDSPVIGFSGELRLKKGIHFLLQAFSALRDRMECRLLIIGHVRKNDLGILEGFFASHPRLKDHVMITGHIQDREQLVRHYRIPDVFVFPSLWEGMPNSVLEAMACGKVVVATAVGGIPDVVENGKTGILLRFDELDHLDRFIEKAVHMSRADREAFGRAARERVCREHTSQQELEGNLSLYQDILSRG